MKKKLTQNQIKDRQEKAKKIKHLLIRSLNIICYILSALFIIMAIAVGAQSCSNKEKVSASVEKQNAIHLKSINDNDMSKFKYLYTLKWANSDTANILMTYFDDFLLDNGVEVNKIADYQPSNGGFTYNIDDAILYAFLDGDLVPLNRFNVFYGYRQISGTRYRADITRIAIRDVDAYDILNLTQVNTLDITYSVTSNIKLLTSDDLSSNQLLNLLYDNEEINPISFTFNNQINYNATYGGNLGQPFLSANITGTYKDLDFGWFISGGSAWDTIRVYWMDANASAFKLEDGTIYQNSAGTGVFYNFIYMSYRNSISGVEVMVNQRNQVAYDKSGGLGYYFDNSSTWISSNYQTITLLTNTSETNITELNKYNNTSSSGGNITSGNIGLEGGFSIIKTSFSSLIPFLSIQVLPGISMFLLLLIPTIVIIIILVFKVVKK